MKMGYCMKGKPCGAVLLVTLLLCLFMPTARAAPVPCAPDQHKYDESRRTPATAMEDGEIEYVCSVCGNAYKKILFATDHLWGDWVTDREPTCTRPGQRHRVCTRGQPHEEDAAIPALEHSYKESIVQPTCEAPGTKTFSCARCGDSYTERIDPLGHDYREAERVEPTCLEPGKVVYICARDPAHTYEDPIDTSGSHDFSDWQTATPAREGADGLETRECARCGHVETHVLAALPPPTEPSRAIPLMDIVLVGASVVSLGGFSFLLIPYFLCLLYVRRRLKKQEELEALRREVDARRGFK